MVRDWIFGDQLGEGNLGEGGGVYKGPVAQTNPGSVHTKSRQGVSLVGPLHPFSPLASHLMFSKLPPAEKAGAAFPSLLWIPQHAPDLGWHPREIPEVTSAHHCGVNIPSLSLMNKKQGGHVGIAPAYSSLLWGLHFSFLLVGDISKCYLSARK